MSKYIIEIPDDVQYVLLNGQTDNKYYTAVRPIAELEELNSDYSNEHYGELQDEAYQRGLEDGKWKAEDGCDGVSKDGRACHVLLNNVRKTGKHYDIASILEAMRE